MNEDAISRLGKSSHDTFVSFAFDTWAHACCGIVEEVGTAAVLMSALYGALLLGACSQVSALYHELLLGACLTAFLAHEAEGRQNLLSR